MQVYTNGTDELHVYILKKRKRKRETPKRVREENERRAL
jgi:hypothetical protein